MRKNPVLAILQLYCTLSTGNFDPKFDPIYSSSRRDMPVSAPLVPCQLIRLDLDATHASTGHPPGTYAAVVMPRYIDSVARMSPSPDPSGLVSGGRRMIEALGHIHSLGFVHMDVKVGARRAITCPP